MKVCIVGAGATGLTAAYELLKKGHRVTVYERENHVGGLVGTLKVGELALERFYHHIFTSDTDLLSLVDELGLTEHMLWLPPVNGMYVDRTLYPFTSPADLLRFKALPLIDRIRMGSLIFRAKFVKDWREMESIPARNWLIDKAGRNSYDKVWGPLLASKFDSDADNISAVWIWNKFKLRGSTRGKNISKELLGYMHGSFGMIYERLRERITRGGGEIIYGQGIDKILPQTDQADADTNILPIEVHTPKGIELFDRVIVTSAPETFRHMLGVPLPEAYESKLKQIRYKSNLCMVLELNSSLSPYYWITVAEKDAPFALVLEHTNLVGVEGYGRHIVYLSRYIDEKTPLYSQSNESIQKVFLDYLGTMFRQFDKRDIHNVTLSRARYAQPVVRLNYSKIIPEIATPIPGLYLASMAQIYPEDRGQNYSVRMGRIVANLIDPE